MPGIIRVGVTIYPGYVEPCVLQESNVLKMRCKDPGLSVKVLQLLQLAIKSQYSLKLINLPRKPGVGAWATTLEGFKNNTVDMSVDLWTLTYKRQLVADFSDAVIYSTRSFITSSKNLATHVNEISLMPLPTVIWVNFLAMGLLLSIFRSVARLYSSQNRLATFLTCLGSSLFQSYAVYVKQPLPLGIRDIKKWERGPIALLWMFSSLIFCGIYAGYFTTSFFMRISLPFASTLDLAGALNS